MNYYNIFPTKITTFRCKTFKKSLKKIAKKNIPDGSMFSSDMNVLHKKQFREIKKEILEKCQLYSQKFWGLNLDNPTISCSWFSKLNNEDRIGSHRHMHSYISGVLYLTKGSEIVFQNPSDPSGIMPDVINFKNNHQFPVKPKKGLCVLFPSSLYHSVHQSKAGKRYSLAFNVNPSGQVGPKTGYIHIK